MCMKRTLVFVLLAYSSLICRAQFTLKDWNIDGIDENATLRLDVSEYKLNYNHPLPYADWQKCWTVKVELCCGTLGTEQVFVCKEGKRSILAINTLREAGYKGPMYNLKGGIDAAKDIVFAHEGAWL